MSTCRLCSYAAVRASSRSTPASRSRGRWCAGRRCGRPPRRPASRRSHSSRTCASVVRISPELSGACSSSRRACSNSSSAASPRGAAFGAPASGRCSQRGREQALLGDALRAHALAAALVDDVQRAPAGGLLQRFGEPLRLPRAGALGAAVDQRQLCRGVLARGADRPSASAFQQRPASAHAGSARRCLSALPGPARRGCRAPAGAVAAARAAASRTSMLATGAARPAARSAARACATAPRGSSHRPTAPPRTRPSRSRRRAGSRSSRRRAEGQRRRPRPCRAPTSARPWPDRPICACLSCGSARARASASRSAASLAPARPCLRPRMPRQHSPATAPRHRPGGPQWWMPSAIARAICVRIDVDDRRQQHGAVGRHGGGARRRVPA